MDFLVASHWVTDGLLALVEASLMAGSLDRGSYQRKMDIPHVIMTYYYYCCQSWQCLPADCLLLQSLLLL
jgi:hypothetical protein